jgi:transcriptional regulator with XRE-family HTH domain
LCVLLEVFNNDIKAHFFRSNSVACHQYKNVNYHRFTNVFAKVNLPLYICECLKLTFMNNRIRQFMDYKGLSSSELADSIGVQRSNVTHVLQGRNKPGFLFISKLLETYPEVNAKWLITGQDNMLIGETHEPVNLFNFSPDMKKGTDELDLKDGKEEEKPDELINNPQKAFDAVNTVAALNNKDIERIVVFYTDQTFKQYLPAK